MEKSGTKWSKGITFANLILCVMFVLPAISGTAYGKGETPQEKKILKQNKEAEKNAPVKKSGKWRPFTRAVNPGENPEKKGLKKGTFLQSGISKGRPPKKDTYNKDMGIPHDRKKTEIVKGYYKPDKYKKFDIKGKDTKHNASQEVPVKDVPAKNVKITNKQKIK